MAAIHLEYTAGAVGPTKIKAGQLQDNEPPPLVDINLSGEPNVNVDVSSPPGKVVAVSAIINGNSLNPVAALVSSPPGEVIAADVGATINGGTPVTAIIEGGTAPVSAAVKATVTSPITLDVKLGEVALRNSTVKVKLLGWFTILTIEVGP